MIFIDSNVYIAYYNKDDSQHDKAVALFQKIDSGQLGKEITSDYVFDEAVTVTLARTKDMNKAIELGNHILGSTLVLNTHEHVFEGSWQLFKENKARLSFTDCTNIELVKSFNIGSIATFDKAFKGLDGIKVVDV